MAANTRIVNDAATLQTELNNAVNQNISRIVISEDFITINAPIILPNNLFAPGKHLIIEGNGCTIKPAVAGVLSYIMQMNTTFQPGTILKSRFTFKDITFDGRSGAVPITALELTGTLQSELDNCRFIDCATGLKLQYAPQTRIMNCSAKNITGIAIDINKLTSLNPSNAYGSPFCRIENFTIDQRAGMFAAINLIASGNCIISQYASIGPVANQPQYHIYFDSNVWPDANSIIIDNIHFNAAAAVAGISLTMFGGYATISHIVSTIDQVLIEASDTQSAFPTATKPRVYVSHYPRISNGTQFRTGKGCNKEDIIWEFFDINSDPNGTGGRRIFDLSRWWLANVPTHRYSEYFEYSTQDKEIVTNSMKVNTNVIS